MYREHVASRFSWDTQQGLIVFLQAHLENSVTGKRLMDDIKKMEMSVSTSLLYVPIV